MPHARKEQSLSRPARLIAGASFFLFASSAAVAQESVLITPEVPNDFDRGRNVSVTEQSRPEYDPVGLRAGSFRVQAGAGAGVGYTSNALLSVADRQNDAYFDFNPRLGAVSDWSRHLVRLAASANLRRYTSVTLRDENSYDLGALGRVDIGPSTSVSGEVQYARQYESNLTGEIDPDLAQLSRYDRSLLAVRADHRSGRMRLLGSYDRSTFRFSAIDQEGATPIDQAFRDRDVDRLRGQVEYAVSPSLAAYGQFTYDWTDYTQNTNADPARSSKAWRLITGLNFDFSGKMRGTIGAGYTRRNYDLPIYTDASGASFEAKVEFFPSELTTYSVGVRRILADSSISGSSAYFDNRLSLRADHELRRNVLVNATFDIAKQDYIGSPRSNWIYRFRSGARLFANRHLRLDLSAGYLHRKQDGPNALGDISEFTVRTGVLWQL